MHREPGWKVTQDSGRPGLDPERPALLRTGHHLPHSCSPLFRLSVPLGRAGGQARRGWNDTLKELVSPVAQFHSARLEAIGFLKTCGSPPHHGNRFLFPGEGPGHLVPAKAVPCGTRLEAGGAFSPGGPPAELITLLVCCHFSSLWSGEREGHPRGQRDQNCYITWGDTNIARCQVPDLLFPNYLDNWVTTRLQPSDPAVLPLQTDPPHYEHK